MIHVFKNLDITVDTRPENIETHVRDVVRRLVDGWSGLSDQQILLKEFTGGITNKLYRASVDENGKLHHVLVRMYGNKTEKLIDRPKELQNLEHLHGLGLGPKLYGTFSNGYVYGYFEGQALDPSDLRAGRYVHKIAKHLAKWHSQHLPGERKSNLWETIWNWISLVPDTYGDPVKDQKSKDIKRILAAEAKSLHAALQAVDSPIVFSHNDLLGPNIINQQDGHIQFIDYEYASYIHRGFDFGNHFNEWAGFDLQYDKYPTKEQQFEYFRHYLGHFGGKALMASRDDALSVECTEAELNKLYAEANKYALASHFYWGTWGLVQAHISDIDFDFLQYGLDRFKQYFAVRDEYLAL